MAFDKKREYWGALPDFDEKFACEVVDRFERFQVQLERCGLKQATLAHWRMYMSRDDQGGYATIRATGKRGEILSVPFSEYRALVSNQLEMVTNKPLSFQALAKRADADAVIDALDTEKLIEHYAETKLEYLRRPWAEGALTGPGSWLSQAWNPFIGPKVELATGEVGPEGMAEQSEAVFGGDLDFRLHSIFDVAYPVSGNLHTPEWMIFRVRMSRHLLAGTVGEGNHKLCEEIYEAPNSKKNVFEEQSKAIVDPELDDYVDVYLATFAPSPILPYGRIAWVLDKETVLVDGPNPYERIPATLLASATVVGEGMPHCSNFDLYAIMCLQRKGYSTLASHLDASHQVIHSSDAPAKFSMNNFGPFRVLFSPTPPTVLQMFNATKEMFAWPEVLRQVAQRFSNVSDAARGESESSESGAKMRMEQSISQGFQGGFIRIQNVAMGDATTLSKVILENHLSEERTFAVVGRRQKSDTIRITGAKLKTIERVRVQQVDSAADTPEGKQQIADMALEKGWIKYPDEYVIARRTGQLDVAEGGIIDMGTTVMQDVETLKQLGAPMPPVLTMDDHQRAIAEAQKATFDRSIRDNPEVVQRLQEYAMAHASYLTPGHPNFSAPLMQALNQQPLGAAPGVGGPGGISPNAPPVPIPSGIGGAAKPPGQGPGGAAAKPPGGAPASLPGAPKQLMGPGAGDAASTGMPGRATAGTAQG